MDQLHAAQAAPRHGKALAIDGQRHRRRCKDGRSAPHSHSQDPRSAPCRAASAGSGRTGPGRRGCRTAPRPARHRRRCRAPPQVARDLFAQRGPALRLVACQLGRRQLSGADGQPAPGRHGKQRGVGAARGEWRFGGLRLVRRRHRLLMRQRARRPPGRETGRGERGLARLIPGIRAQGRPALSWQSLAEEVIWNDGATYVPDPTVPAV